MANPNGNQNQRKQNQLRPSHNRTPKGEITMNELIIRFNKETHKPKYIGIARPAKDCNKCDFKNETCNRQANKCEHGAILKHIYGNPNSIIEPIPDQEE
jgi:hypothetical protein